MYSWFTSKRCNHCGGNIVLDRDNKKPYLRCLQCGRETEGRDRPPDTKKTGYPSYPRSVQADHSR